MEAQIEGEREKGRKIEAFEKLVLGQICPARSKHAVLQGDATSVCFFQFFPYKDE